MSEIEVQYEKLGDVDLLPFKTKVNMWLPFYVYLLNIK